MANNELLLRLPTAEDGAAVHDLIGRCPPLDTNSMYCNLVQCSHFSSTSVVAELNGELVGFISGHPVPAGDNTLFIWQVAVGEAARGKGLATKMLKAILQRPQNLDFRHIETTITDDNEGSWALFKGLAKKLNTGLERTVMFDREKHFGGSHDTEYLARIGPFNVSEL